MDNRWWGGSLMFHLRGLGEDKSSSKIQTNHTGLRTIHYKEDHCSKRKIPSRKTCTWVFKYRAGRECVLGTCRGKRPCRPRGRGSASRGRSLRTLLRRGTGKWLLRKSQDLLRRRWERHRCLWFAGKSKSHRSTWSRLGAESDAVPRSLNATTRTQWSGIPEVPAWWALRRRRGTKWSQCKSFHAISSCWVRCRLPFP